MPPKRNISTAAILAAGLGTRIQGLTHAKPLLKLRGETLVELQTKRFLSIGMEKVIVAMREELLDQKDKSLLLQDPRVQYIFVNTASSLHTLGEVVKICPSTKPLLVTMVDTILSEADFKNFSLYIENLSVNHSSLLCTRYIDDENPLYVHTNIENVVTHVGSEVSPIVTSGMYLLSPTSLKYVEDEIQSGTQKMRNFLNQSISRGHIFTSYIIEKSIDLDRPEDLMQAEKFL